MGIYLFFIYLFVSLESNNLPSIFSHLQWLCSFSFQQIRLQLYGGFVWDIAQNKYILYLFTGTHSIYLIRALHFVELPYFSLSYFFFSFRTGRLSLYTFSTGVSTFNVHIYIYISHWCWYRNLKLMHVSVHLQLKPNIRPPTSTKNAAHSNCMWLQFNGVQRY